MRKTIKFTIVNKCLHKERVTNIGTCKCAAQHIWNGVKPDISYMAIFYCMVMVHIPKEKRLKWDKKSKKVIFIDIFEYQGKKGYSLNNNLICKISVTRDV